METKKGFGDAMNQIGIISDLLERVNLNTKEITVTIELESDDFNELHDRVVKRRGVLLMPKKTFNMMVSGVKFIFNKV